MWLEVLGQMKNPMIIRLVTVPQETTLPRAPEISARLVVIVLAVLVSGISIVSGRINSSIRRRKIHHKGNIQITSSLVPVPNTTHRDLAIAALLWICVRFVKLMSDTFCGIGAFKMNIRLCCHLFSSILKKEILLSVR
jgi:hypothetical protein